MTRLRRVERYLRGVLERQLEAGVSLNPYSWSFVQLRDGRLGLGRRGEACLLGCVIMDSNEPVPAYDEHGLDNRLQVLLPLLRRRMGIGLNEARQMEKGFMGLVRGHDWIEDNVWHRLGYRLRQHYYETTEAADLPTLRLLVPRSRSPRREPWHALAEGTADRGRDKIA